MAAAAAAALGGGCVQMEERRVRLPSFLLSCCGRPSLPPSLWLARSWMAIYLCLRTLCEGEREREGGSGASAFAPEDNSNFHLSNCKT